LGETAQLSNKTFGLADLTNSIFNSLSVSQTTDTLGIGPLEQRECLILIDGLGQDGLNRYGEEFEIFSQLKQVKNLSANFPSTTALALKAQPSFVYTYLNTLDSAGHSDGVGSDKWLTALSQVSEFITKVKSSAPAGTRVWVTSDHGMVNSTQQIILGQDNDLLKNVTLIGGEPRARHIYIKEGAESETISQWQEQLAGKAQVLSKESAISSGLFGEVVLEDSRERMGDLIAIAQNDLILIDPARIREESSMVGHHGGVTNTEVEIPLLLG